jgi:PmbA protein
VSERHTWTPSTQDRYSQEDFIRGSHSNHTGDYSQGAVGFWIEKGELTYPVEEITIAGNLKEMLLEVEMVGNDLNFRRSVVAPTLKIRRMTVAGH